MSKASGGRPDTTGSKRDTERLPRILYRAEQVRRLDRIAIEQAGIPGRELMERAGVAAFRVLRDTWPAAQRIGVLCGTGNNAGDGFVLARHAVAAGLTVNVLQVGDGARIQGDAASACRDMEAAGLQCQRFVPDSSFASEVIVDGLFGTGLARPVDGIWAEAINAANAAREPVLALDLPSGLHADSGSELGVAVLAAATVSFIGLKRGAFTARGRACCGRLSFDSLDVPGWIFDREPAEVRRLVPDDERAALGPRSRDSHKGDFGHVLLVGGEHGYAGAARMASEAAARVGAGLVSVATRREHAAVLGLGRPELMCRGVETRQELEPLLQRATVIAVGPGLGQSAWGREMFAAVLGHPVPLVVDADALNLLAQLPQNDLPKREDWVLTPHPGEAGRLLGRSTAEVEANRFAAVGDLRVRYGGSCVLKGAGTLVLGADGETGICDGGNPGMASGGMGDVLTGIIAGLVAQGISPVQAARAGVCVHAWAADRAARSGERGMLAGDLMAQLRRAVNA